MKNKNRLSYATDVFLSNRSASLSQFATAYSDDSASYQAVKEQVYDTSTLQWTMHPVGFKEIKQAEDIMNFSPFFTESMTNAIVRRMENNKVSIPSDFLARSPSDDCVCLIEGRAATQAPLFFEVVCNDQVVFRKEIPVRISATTDMFRVINLRPHLDGSSSPSTSTDTPPNRPYESNGKNVFLVHGFRVGNTESLGWGSEFFKKLLRSGSRADFWLVTWEGNPSDGMDYYWAVNNAFKTAPYLADVLDSISGEKILLAHSLGNMVASSAIADHDAPVSKYFALDAAVASEAYDGTLFNTATNNPLVHSYWVEYRTESWSSCWNQLFPDTDDRSRLTWIDRFADVAVKTELYNYYSSDDEVLEIGNQGISLLEDGFNFRQSSWHKQEVFKGRNIFYGNGWGGWGFESNVTATAVSATPLSVLQKCPIFEEGPEEMYDSVIETSMQNKILGYAIPALSEPLGRTRMDYEISRDNVNMDTMQSNDWCRNDSLHQNDWLHSDIQNATYFYTYKIFDAIVSNGEEE